MLSSNSGTRSKRWRRMCMRCCSWRQRKERCSIRKPRWAVKGALSWLPSDPAKEVPVVPLWKADKPSEPSAFAARAVWQAGVPSLSLQISAAQRLLEKGNEAPDKEPERSWFQTKEERKKEKSKSGIPPEAEPSTIALSSQVCTCTNGGQELSSSHCVPVLFEALVRGWKEESDVHQKLRGK